MADRRFLSLIPGHGPRHEPILSVVVKKTYAVVHGKECFPDEVDSIPLHEVDSFYDENDPILDAPKHECDLVAFKPLTDVIFHGCARAPRGRQALFLDVGISINKVTRILRVIGNRRVYVTGTEFDFTDPEPFESMRLDYSRAYGGVDRKSRPGADLVYPPNPVGKGFVCSRNPEALQDLPLPNLEDIGHLLKPQNLVVDKYGNWAKCPPPVSFGYVPRNSHPRILQAGFSRRDHVDAEANRLAALSDLEEIGVDGTNPHPGPNPLLNPEYHNGASPGLKLPYLRGDERVLLKHMDAANPDFEFRLNPAKPKPWIDIGRGKQYLHPVLQTLEIFKESNQCTMVWRGSARYGGPEWFKKYPHFSYGADN